jgi:putative spermidine/putrescine transport system substrate-binding protein
VLPLFLICRYLLTSGTLADTNFLAIPINAPNLEAALVAVNYIGSAAAMFKRAIPGNEPDGEWGAIQAFDPFAEEMIEWDAAFDYINLHEATPSVEELAAARLADVNAAMVATINAAWAVNVRDYDLAPL